jgi:hypothetical protein
VQELLIGKLMNKNKKKARKSKIVGKKERKKVKQISPCEK